MSDTWQAISGNLNGSTQGPTQAVIPSGGGAPAAKRNITQSPYTYPNPAYDMTNTFMPKSLKEVLKYVAEVAYTDPLVSQAVVKLAEYPVTDMLYDHKNGGSEFKNDELIAKWRYIMEDCIDIRSSMIQSGMDYHGFGNSVTSVHFPFIRMLKCSKCGEIHSADLKGVSFRAWEFHSTCPKCGYKGVFSAQDYLERNFKKIRVIHWDLTQLDIKFNSISGDHFYYYTVPSHIKSAIDSGDMDFVKTTRLEVIKACKSGAKVKLLPENTFHMKRQSPQYIFPSERGWGVSTVFSVMKDVFHNRILKKGNEMIALDHIVPLRIITPQPMGDMSPHLTMDLSGWRAALDREIGAWRRDGNHIMYAPIPVEIANMGGDARALMVTPEIKANEENIIVGMGIIPEILKGGASWSGSSVSLRIIENSHLNHRRSLLEQVKFVRNSIANTYNIQKVEITMTDFKMADDSTQKQILLSACQGSPTTALISKKTVIKELGLDPEVEFNNKQEELRRSIELLTHEKKGFAHADGEASIINAIFSADAQSENNNRIKMREREAIGEQNKADMAQKDQESNAVYEEFSALAKNIGIDPSTVDMSNIISRITERLQLIQTNDGNLFAQVMLRIKGSYPNVYAVVYNNFKEMNSIKADTMPDLATVQKYTPGEIPTYSQGGSTGDGSADPIEQAQQPVKINAPAPVSNPPRRAGADM